MLAITTASSASSSSFSTLLTYLEEHPDTERMLLCLDSDEAGQSASKDFESKLAEIDVESVNISPWPHKHWNKC